MSKRNKIKLSIPEPCSQDWDKMTPDEKGRRCDLCSKSVVDFSKFTDKELLEFFSKVKEKVCGRFNNYQLNRPIAVYQPADTPIFKRLLFGTALAAGVATIAQAQTPVQNDSVNSTQEQTTSLDSAAKVLKPLIVNAPPTIPDTGIIAVADTEEIISIGTVGGVIVGEYVEDNSASDFWELSDLEMKSKAHVDQIAIPVNNNRPH